GGGDRLPGHRRFGPDRERASLQLRVRNEPGAVRGRQRRRPRGGTVSPRRAAGRQPARAGDHGTGGRTAPVAAAAQRPSVSRRAAQLAADRDERRRTPPRAGGARGLAGTTDRQDYDPVPVVN